MGGTRVPQTAEALMRSRYSAYVLENEPYLLATWHASTRPTPPLFDTHPLPKWIGLQVRSHRQTDETHAEVEFIARYRVGGRAHRLHETSRFTREDGHWLYLDGDMHEADKDR
ncbi:MAG: YchJ family protein [Azoarcus sp.]